MRLVCLLLVVPVTTTIIFIALSHWSLSSNYPSFNSLASNPTTSPTTWTNVAQSISCAAHRLHQPSSEAALAQVVRTAHTRFERVKVIGAGHSFSPLVCPSSSSSSPIEHLVQLDYYSSLVSVDADKRHATFQAGVRVRDVHVPLAAHGLALPVMGSIGEQSLAGAISTGTHGSSHVLGSMSSLVVEVRVVGGDGRVLRASGTLNRELFDAVRLGLGVVGVISTVTLQCVDAFMMRKVESASQPLEDVLQAWDQASVQHEYYQMYWVPHTDLAREAYVERITNDEAAAEYPTLSNNLKRWLEPRVIGLFALLARVEAWVPALTPVLHSVAAKLMNRVESVDVSHALIHQPVPGSYTYDAEYYFPLDKCTDAVRKFRAAVEQCSDYNLLNGAVTLRYVAQDKGILLSPTFDGPRCALDVFTVRNGQSAAIDDALVKVAEELDGRPHWGKIHRLNEYRAHRMYPGLNQFLRVREHLDPHGTFMHEDLMLLLGVSDQRAKGEASDPRLDHVHDDRHVNPVGGERLHFVTVEDEEETRANAKVQSDQVPEDVAAPAPEPALSEEQVKHNERSLREMETLMKHPDPSAVEDELSQEIERVRSNTAEGERIEPDATFPNKNEHAESFDKVDHVTAEELHHETFGIEEYDDDTLAALLHEEDGEGEGEGDGHDLGIFDFEHLIDDTMAGYEQHAMSLEDYAKSIFSTFKFEVFGKVQGVYFRATTQEFASDLKITGWVANTHRGTVVGEAEGTFDDLEQLRYWLGHVGSFHSKIDKLVISDEHHDVPIDQRRFTKFEVDYEYKD